MREATRRGFGQAPRRVVMGDGAVRIWNLAQEQFPGAIQSVARRPRAELREAWPMLKHFD